MDPTYQILLFVRLANHSLDDFDAGLALTTEHYRTMEGIQGTLELNMGSTSTWVLYFLCAFPLN